MKRTAISTAFCLLSIVYCLVSIVGCSKLQYMEQALALKAFAEEKGAQEQYVKEYNAKFDKLYALVKANDLGDYQTQENFLEDFDEPIMKKYVQFNKKPAMQWLYRYAYADNTPGRVYLTFDPFGNLLHSELE